MDPIFVTGWLIIIGAWLLFEGVGIKDGSDRYPSFTDLVRKYIPKGVLVAVLAWVVYHFLFES